MSFEKVSEKQSLLLTLNNEFDFGPFTWGDEVGGFSSRNFSLTCGSKSFILKQLGLKAANQVKRLETIALFLRDKHFCAPFPEATRTGKRYFFYETKVYMLFLRNAGSIRHRDDLAEEALKNTAERLAILHLLKGSNIDSLLGRPRRHLHRDPLPLASEENFCARAKEIYSKRETIEVLQESLSIKRRLIEESNYEESLSLEIGPHFVHGDFHNENILFNTEDKVTCVLDFEESFLGQGVCDVINFVFMALYSEGFSSRDIDRARIFLHHYNSIIPTEKILLEKAIKRHFLAMASSTFFEEKLVEGQEWSADLLRRDIEKFKAWKENKSQWIRALLS